MQSSGSQKKRIEVFPGGTHNETWICPGYYEAIISFMVQVGGMCVWVVVVRLLQVWVHVMCVTAVFGCSVGGGVVCVVSVASVCNCDVCDCSVCGGGVCDVSVACVCNCDVCDCSVWLQCLWWGCL